MIWAGLDGAMGYALLISVIGVFIGLIIYLRARERLQLGVRFPARERVRSIPQGWRVKFRNLPTFLRWLVLCVILIALARPQKIEADTAEVEGIDIAVST